MSNGWLVYILRCCDDSLYTGITNNLERRLAAHNNGTGAKYTAGRRPVGVVYQSPCNSKSHAAKLEASIKKLSRAQKLQIINDVFN